MTRQELKEKCHAMRKRGWSHSEIAASLKIPRPTIVVWNRSVELNARAKARLALRKARLLAKAQAAAAESHRTRKAARKLVASNNAESLIVQYKNPDARKLVLGTLYLGEGSKGDRSVLTFGNSDPNIIRLFLKLLREAYVLDESKFRCTVQARLGQNASSLEVFWSVLTGIPKSQFYGTRFDGRSAGQKTRKENYKGVCRIDYLSADLLYEILAVGTMLTRQ